MVATSNKTLCFQGIVYDDKLGEQLKTVLIANGRIEQVWDGILPAAELPDEAVLLTLAHDEVLFPGFINLHVHTGYNVFPLWDSPSQEWKNRYQWRANAQYKKDIKDFAAYISNEWHLDSPALVSRISLLLNLPEPFSASPEALLQPLSEVKKAHAIIAELQAVAGGTSLVQQTVDLDTEKPTERSFIIRNTANPAELGLEERDLISVVDFYRPRSTDSGSPLVITGEPTQDTSTWLPRPEDVTSFEADVRAGNATRFATLAHLAEGRAGYLQEAGPDPYTRAEFAAFMVLAKQMAADTGNLAQAHLLLTHATGIDVTDPAALRFLRDHGIALVWSPVSNLLLYSDTLPVHVLLDADITVCLGSDWSPSGSKHVWDELKFAKYFLEQRGVVVADVDLYRMVTVNPARALGNLKAGRIRPGYHADFFVLHKQASEQSALEALFTCDDSRVKYVVVNGRVVYGEEGIFKHFLQVDYQPIPATEGSFAAGMAVSINSHLNFNLEKALLAMDTLVNNYSSNVLHKSMQRPRLLAADDEPYQARIAQLREQVRQI